LLSVPGQNIVGGLLVGSLYGLAALGLSLVFGVLKILNVAHGELIMLGGYAAFWMFSVFGLDPFLALLLVIPLLFCVGWALHRGLFHRIVQFDQESRIKSSLLIGFGLTLVLHNLAIILWTADERAVTTAYATAAWTGFGLRFPVVRMAGFGVSLVAVVAMEWFLERTTLGTAIRATAEDWRSASLTGINIQNTYLLTFALGAALAGTAGTLISVAYSVNPSIGLGWTLKALIVVVLAGLGSMRGTFLAGLLLGVAESVSAFLIGGQYRALVGLIIFLIVLSLRPQGLFGVQES
jgi:branched-chain amino acid transport system permease protein